MSDTRSKVFMLEASDGGHVFTLDPDGSGKRVLDSGCRIPDGITVDAGRGHIYWTNMGNPAVNDGSIERVNLDGTDRVTIVPPGGTYTPKRLQLDTGGQKLYWADREGMRVMRCDLDGANIETLVRTGQGDDDRRDQTRWCVGIAVDPDGGHFYWTQKGPSNAGLGKILRAGLEMPVGDTARGDIEVLYDRLPEPIDLELDLKTRTLYWTDRGDPPRGNTVNRAPMDPSRDQRDAPEILWTHLEEGIGIALDLAGDRMWVTDLAGSIYLAHLDGAGHTQILAAQGNLTGIAYAELPATLMR